MKKEQTIDFNIKIAWHAISRMYSQYGQKFEISPSTGFVLLNIDSNEGTPATKIAPLMGLETRSLTRILKAMESKKWIMRQKDPLDGRSVRIFLTTLGKQKREISRRSVKAFNQHILEKTNSDQLKIFFQVMNVINDVATDKEKIQSFLVEIND
jgi:MarR family transcriptional regulator, organic hydroperoxide resistance regulator|tara:strand:- start:11043 stop:11504 length:462 start_codon:yes stop_codon:yes gene_type:complete